MTVAIALRHAASGRIGRTCRCEGAGEFTANSKVSQGEPRGSFWFFIFWGG